MRLNKATHIRVVKFVTREDKCKSFASIIIIIIISVSGFLFTYLWRYWYSLLIPRYSHLDQEDNNQLLHNNQRFDRVMLYNRWLGFANRIVIGNIVIISIRRETRYLALIFQLVLRRGMI